jgi:hypothetical protein
MIREYPLWTCEPCGVKHGTGKRIAVSTYHFGRCDVCGKNNPVTQPRDFGHFGDWFNQKGGKNGKHRIR